MSATSLRATWSATMRSLIAAVLAVLALRPLGPWALKQIGSTINATRATLVVETLQLAVAGLLGALVVSRQSRAAVVGERLVLRGAVISLLLSPAAYVVTRWTATAIALPTLMREMNRYGTGVSRANAEPIARVLTQPSWVETWLAAALVAALVEEFVFRGLVWETVASLLRGRIPNGATALAASAVSVTLFAWLHADVPGGVGIVRFVAAIALGTTTALARSLSGSIVPCVILHAANNSITLLTARGALPMFGVPVFGVPLLLVAVASVLAPAALYYAVFPELRRRKQAARLLMDV